MIDRNTLNIQYVVDLLDRGTRPLLTADKQVRRSLQETNREWDQTARSAKDSASRQVSSARRVESGTRAVGRAALSAGGEMQGYVQAQDDVLDAGRKIIDQSSRVESALRRQARAGATGPARGSRASAAASGGLLAGLRAGPMAALGTAGAVAFSAAFKKALDISGARALLAAQLGLSAKQSARYGQLAGRLYAENYGNSTEQVNEAIRSVVTNIDGMRKASDRALKQTSGNVLNLANTFDQDLGGVTNAISQMLRTGLAKNAKDAANILTVGFQAGNDKAGDLLDTINEYGTQWRKVGLDGATAMGLISQGLKAGARDSDIVADAIKEFSIRAVDGSKTTRQGFDGIGLSARDMSERIAKGGKSAEQGLQLTLDKLRDVEDPAKRARLAVDLFGTQAEDLGKALYKLDPSRAEKAIGRVGNAADKMGKTLSSSPAAALEKFKRMISTDITNALGSVILGIQNIAPKVAGVASDVGHAIKVGVTTPVKAIAGLIAAYFNAVKTIIGDVVQFLKDRLADVLGVFQKILEAASHLPIIGGKFKGAAEEIRGMRDALYGVKDATDDLNTSLDRTAQNITNAFAGGNGIFGTLPSPHGVHNPHQGPARSTFRRGGVAGYQGGGLIPAMVSSGEEVVYGGSAWRVPGQRTAADNVFAMLPAGAAVLTDHGQALRDAGASLADAINMQLPHFATGGIVLTPGQMAGLAYTHGVRPKREAIRMGAIGMRESHGRARAHNYDPPRDDSYGLWQINVLPQANPRFKSWNLRDPDVNARAMSILHKASGEGPWGGYPESSFSRYITAASRGFSTPARGGGKRPGALGDFDRSENPFGVGYQAGLGGARSLGGDILAEALRAARISKPTTRTDHARGNAGAPGGVPSAVGRAIAAANTINGHHYVYSSPGNRTPGLAGPMDCSGAVSKVAIAAGLLGTVQASPYFLNWGQPGPGKYLTTWSRGGYGSSGHVFMRIRGRYFGTSSQNQPGGGAGWFPKFPGGTGWSVRHPKGFRAGGIIGRTVGRAIGTSRPGQLVDRLTNAPASHGANSQVGAILKALAGQLDDVGEVSYQRLRALSDGMAHAIAELKRSTEDRRQNIQIRRLTIASRLAKTEMGRRTGQLVAGVDARGQAMDTATTRLGQQLRRDNVDAESPRGLAAQMHLERQQQREDAKNRRELVKARRRARRAGDTDAVSDITQRIKDVDERTAERGTNIVEQARQKITAHAQKIVDAGQYRVDSANSTVAFQEAAQRVAGTDDTSQGMRDRAKTLTDVVGPALTSFRDGLLKQGQALAGIDPAGSKAAFLAANQAATDLANNMASAADLIKQAGKKTVDDAVDNAQHGINMANIGLQGLEITEQISGTYDTDTGRTERANYIKTVVEPAIDKAITDAQNQLAYYVSIGDTKTANAIEEAIGGLRNDRNAADKDVKDLLGSIGDNTAELAKQFGGTLAFSGPGGQTYTDDLLSTFSGA